MIFNMFAAVVCFFLGIHESENEKERMISMGFLILCGIFLSSVVNGIVIRIDRYIQLKEQYEGYSCKTLEAPDIFGNSKYIVYKGTESRIVEFATREK